MIDWLLCFGPVVRQCIMAGTRGRVKPLTSQARKQGGDWSLTIPFKDTSSVTCRPSTSPSTSPCLLKVLPPPNSAILETVPLTQAFNMGLWGTEYSYCSTSTIQSKSLCGIFFNLCFKEEKEVK